MIEKPKRPKRIPNQDNKQPQTIQELIRRYDLDNTKIYDFLDELVGQINLNKTQNQKELDEIKIKATETILYDNSEGINTGSFTIDTTGYERLAFYDTNGQFVGEMLKGATRLNLSYVYPGSTNIYIIAARLYVDDNNFTFYQNMRLYFNGTGWIRDEATLINIIKIIGYR